MESATSYIQNVCGDAIDFKVRGTLKTQKSKYLESKGIIFSSNTNFFSLYVTDMAKNNFYWINSFPKYCF